MKNNFFFWHYSKGLDNLLKCFGNFLSFFWYYFGVKIHFSTLFKTWKRDFSRVSMKGFHPILLSKALIENTFSRIIGAIVRLTVIFFAFLIEIITILSGMILIVFWIFFPLLIIISFFLFFSYFNFPQFQILFAAIFLFSIIVNLLSFSCFRFKEKDYGKMSFDELTREKWFKRVWNRVNKEEIKITEELATNIENLKEYLKQLDISIQEFSKIILWEINVHTRKKRGGKFWMKENLFSMLPIGKDWPFAYTNKLDSYSNDLSREDFSQYKYAQPIGKKRKIEEAELILSRPNQNNLIITGEAGVGKKTVIHSLARRIRTNQTIDSLKNKRILDLDLKAIIASSKDNLKESLHLIFNEAERAGNIILAINNIHEYLKPDSEIPSILSDYLASPSFQIIATTTPQEFRQTVEKHTNITKYWEKISLEETNFEETLKVLLYKLEPLEKNRVFFTYQALRKIVSLSDQYISDSPFPEKALDLMEEVALYWKQNGKTKFIDQTIVEKVVSLKVDVPLGEVDFQESQKLLNLEKILHQRVIGQNFAIESIAETVRKSRIGMMDKEKPLGSFLFLGPTGVGKTETAKTLAEAYFGDDERMIRLDMSEYQKQDSIDRIIGSDSNQSKGHLISQVKNNPHSILLLDEIEKAHPNILDLFLQILDEGSLTDAFGKKVNFKNLIIIATSNAGSIKIQECIKNKLTSKETQEILINHLIENGIFKAEFLNRFDGLVYFHPLKENEIVEIAKLLLSKFANRLKKNKNVSVTFSDEIPQIIAQQSFDEKFGARAIKRYIENEVGDKIVNAILSKKIKKGEDFFFDSSFLE